MIYLDDSYNLNQKEMTRALSRAKINTEPNNWTPYVFEQVAQVLNQAQAIKLMKQSPRFQYLSQELRKAVLSYIAKPTERKWEAIHGVAVPPGLTLWQAVRRTDPTFPSTGASFHYSGRRLTHWTHIPEPDLIIKVLSQ